MYPPVGYHFRVVFKAFPDIDNNFLCVSGLEATMEIDPSATSQSKKTAQVMPVYSTLLLTRAVEDVGNSSFSKWIFDSLGKRTLNPLDEARIELLDENNAPSLNWTIRQITLKSWKLGELHAQKSEVLLETIELSYRQLAAG